MKAFMGNHLTVRQAAIQIVSISAIAAALFAGSPAFAEGASDAADSASKSETGGGLGDIIVTAQRRSENLQKVPITVTAIGGDALQAQHISQVGELAAVVPAMSVQSGGGIISPFLRGIGNTAVTIGNESSVAVYVDGVFSTRLPAGQFALANVQRVEVLKGPQGTLFGRNSSGGVIQIVTKDPSHTTSARADMSYGNMQTVEGSAYITTGLGEKIAADISVAGKSMGKGYGVNHATGDRSFYQDFFTVRSKVLVEATDALTFKLGGFYAWSDATAESGTYPGTTRGYSSPPNTTPSPVIPYYDSNSDWPYKYITKSWGGSLHAILDMGGVTLTSISAYSKQRLTFYSDNDFTERRDGTSTGFGGVDLFTQELQMSSNGTSALKWVTGLFYYNSVAQYFTSPLRSPSGYFTSFARGLDVSGKSKGQSFAGYAQATYELADGLSLVGGLRYTHDVTNGSGKTLVGVVHPLPNQTGPINVAGPPAQIKADKLTYRAAVNYQVQPNLLLYGSASRGYKAAVFNLLTYSPIPTKPEVVDAYEIGFKSELLDNRVRLNVAAWWDKIANPQVTTLDPISRTTILGNAGEARSRGVEADLTIQASSRLSIRANAAYTDSVYTDYTNAGCAPLNPNPPFGRLTTVPCNGTGNVNGNSTPQAPKYTTNLGFDYDFDIGAVGMKMIGDWAYRSKSYFQPSNFTSQSGYHLLSARLVANLNENVSVSIWGKNLTASKYAVRVHELAGSTGSPFLPGEPRTYGVSIGGKF